MSLFLNTNSKEIEAMRDFLMCKNIIVTSGKLGVDNCSIECATLMKRYLGIEISTKDEDTFRCLTLDDVRYVEDMVGYEVPDPFYRGFPESVRNLSTMAEYLDRILHYHHTYGQNNFDGLASHSLFEEIVERTGVEEHVEVKKMILIAPTDFFDTVKDILTEQLKSSRPLDLVSFNALRAYIIYNGSMDDFKEINSRQTLIELFFNFYMEDKNMNIAYNVADKFNLEDVYKLIKLVAAKKEQELNQLSLSNQERKMITLCIRRAFEHTTYNNDGSDKMIEDAYAHRKVWCGILHHIHFKPHTDREKYFVNGMRSGCNHSVMAIFEQYMNAKDTRSAAEYLYRKRGLAFLLRHLDYILSRTRNNDVADDILKIIERDNASTNVVVLLQLYQKYSMPDRAECRTFTYTYNNKVVSYTEEDPKPYSLTVAQRKAVCNCIARTLAKKLANRLEGVAYINPEMSNIGVEINGSATNKGLGTLPVGSRMKLPEGRIFRLFTYWSGADDIDLSMIGLNDQFNICNEFSWRTLGQRGPILFSGDITNGFHGASEYFDVNLTQIKIAYPDMKYLVCCDNLWRGGHGIKYLDQCTCTAGYMVRSDMGSKDGSIFDPKTVATSFKVTSHSKFATLFMIDLETRDLIWVNRSIGSDDSDSRLAANQDFSNMYNIANFVKVMNLAMLIQSAAEGITTNPENADIIVDWEMPENAKEGARLVRPCDTEIVASILK